MELSGMKTPSTNIQAWTLSCEGKANKPLSNFSTSFKAQASLANVLGITYRNGDKIARNADRPFIEDLDSIPFPAHHLMPLESLKRDGKILFPLISSRGCVFWCDFCSTVRMFGRGYRMRSPKNVVDEMQLIHDKYGVKQVTFYDDAFSVDRNRVIKFARNFTCKKAGYDMGLRNPC